MVNYASGKEGADKIVEAFTASGGTAIPLQGDGEELALVWHRTRIESLQLLDRPRLLGCAGNGCFLTYSPLQKQ